MKKTEFWMPIIVSIIVTPIFLLLAIGSAGAGHGDYFLAKILFPFTMLSTIFINSIILPFIILAIIQFPFYSLKHVGQNLALSVQDFQYYSSKVYA